MRLGAVLKAGVVAAALATAAGTAVAAEKAATPPSRSWSFDGIFGSIDRASAQRGFIVYEQACAVCHAMNLVHFRNLAQIGLPEETIQAVASEFFVIDGPDDDGEMFDRPGTPGDRIPAPFPNEQAARAANNGAYPPDLSLMAKARDGGPDYLYALLTGYSDPPADFDLLEGMHYNRYFPGGQIAMAPPLYADSIEFPDGTAATVDQMAHDLVTFLAFTAEPNQESRKRTGIAVLLYLIVLTLLLYMVKRKVWSRIHH
jgi:ubiquinol-cytochrome c reductase cytochrome c1 subunit